MAQGDDRPNQPVKLAEYRRINTAETVLTVLIVFVAAFMVRGVWMF